MNNKRSNIGQRKWKKIVNKTTGINRANFWLNELGMVYVKETLIMGKRTGE